MSNYFDGKSIGPSYFSYDGVDYGFVVGDGEVEWLEDVVDIMSAQFGTQPYDKYITGQAFSITINFGVVTNELIAAMTRGAIVSNSGKAIKFACEKYRSGYENYAKQLKLTAPTANVCDTPSTDPNDRIIFLKAMPSPSGPVVTGPETQRQMSVVFYCFQDRDLEIFGFGGTQTSNGLSGIVIK